MSKVRDFIEAARKVDGLQGAFNIIRKVVPLFNINCLKYGIEDVAVHPMRISFVS